ncbi:MULTISPECIES: cupredoxin domain-containing protein [Halorussus]|uniref:cupredoxin domain-containing protein n=1 Tax=Halorussus TaxID=1070314 RepID=UPI00209F073A|nr:plastocyanin/azurin family copper-binding protein [Halorussus vallis]USZ76320.1 hypothetical protein NGM07_03090 [Halorussus vallis]
MSPRTHDGPSDPASDSPVSRRAMLAAVGAGTAASLAGCTGRADTPENEDATTTGAGTTGTETTEAQGVTTDSSAALDPQFGFVGRSADATPPVEPDHEVQLLIGPREGAPTPEFYFEPAGLFVEPEDVVQFTMATPDHTVTAYHPQLGRTQRVPDGVPAVSSPVLGGGTYWLYRFDAPGVYDLYCAPHEPFGMAFRAVVGEATGPGAEPVSTDPPKHGEPRPPFQTAATVLADAALDPEGIVDARSVSWSDLDPESKRLQS